MDTSRQYVKMSDCPEIQEGHKWEYGDWLIAEHGLFQIGTATFRYDISNSNAPPIRSTSPQATIQSNDVEGSIFTGKLIWLPLQHQLQEMVAKTKTYCAWLLDIERDFHKFANGKFEVYGVEHMPICAVESMEQLWLAFVMHEKYQKVWNGEDWVKESEETYTYRTNIDFGKNHGFMLKEVGH